jgi:hypothetical protein
LIREEEDEVVWPRVKQELVGIPQNMQNKCMGQLESVLGTRRCWIHIMYFT